MSVRLVFQRKEGSDEFDLTESALRKVVGDVRITAACRAAWPIVVACEEAVLEDVRDLMFERKGVTAIEAFERVAKKRPLCFAISRADRVARDDPDAELVCA